MLHHQVLNGYTYSNNYFKRHVSIYKLDLCMHCEFAEPFVFTFMITCEWVWRCWYYYQYSLLLIL